MHLINSHEQDAIIVYDGVCNLCDRSVSFIIRHDGAQKFWFVPFQSDQGRLIAEHFGIDSDSLDSFLLVEKKQVYYKSAAWRRVLRRLSRPCPAYALVLSLTPTIIGDWVYDFVGKNRYKWFGKQEFCDLTIKNHPIPTMNQTQAMLGIND